MNIESRESSYEELVVGTFLWCNQEEKLWFPVGDGVNRVRFSAPLSLCPMLVV